MNATTFHKGMHCHQGDLYGATDRCPVCLDTGRRVATFRVQSSPDVDMLRCGRCRACSASLMPKPVLLDRYYGSYYAGRDAKVTFARPDALARAVAKRVGGLPAHGVLRLLDF